MRTLSTSGKCIRQAAVRWLGVAGVVGLLVFAIACGDDSNNLPPITGNFSNASLNGQYTYSIAGNMLLSDGSGNSNYYVESGVFTADGAGNITAGTDDFSQSGSFGTNSFTGAYQINQDGTGDVVLAIAGSQVSFRITMSDNDHFYMIEDDGFGAGAGSGEKQTASAFAAPPAGTFVFQAHETDTAPSAASIVGRMTLSGGSITGGNEDVLQSNTLFSFTLSGNASSPGTNGRGTITINENGGLSSTYIYYVVDANTFRLARADGFLGLGRAEAQAAGPYTDAMLSGSFVFGASGDTTLAILGAHTVGVFSADGSGAVTGGAFDSVQDGNVQSNVAITGGTYSVASNGRATIGLGGTIITNHVAWMVSPTRAFYLVNNPAKAEDGVMQKQSGTFSNATLSGQYAFFMDGFDTAFKDRVGTFIPDGNGSLRQDQVANSYSPPGPAIVSQSSLSGSYSVDSNGRVTASVNSISNNIVMYMVSGNSAFTLQGDSGVDIGGAIRKQ